jgi:hypothetical protein
MVYRTSQGLAKHVKCMERQNVYRALKVKAEEKAQLR